MFAETRLQIRDITQREEELYKQRKSSEKIRSGMQKEEKARMKELDKQVKAICRLYD